VATEEETALLAQLLVPVKVPTNEPLNDPVLICTELLTNPTGMPVSDDHAVDPIACVGAHDADIANEAVVTVDAVTANEEEITLFAQLEVPISVPVNEPLNEPVLICWELETVPVGNPVGSI
jgi:hypothetical protein